MAKVPSLSATGWVSDVADRVDLLMAHYFVSEEAQSSSHAGNVSSLAYRISQYDNDPNRLAMDLQSDTTKYLGAYFESVDVNIAHDIPNPLEPNKLNITITIFVTSGENKFSVGKLLQIADKKITNIEGVINNG